LGRNSTKFWSGDKTDAACVCATNNGFTRGPSESRIVPGAISGPPVRRDSVELFGRQALAERGHIGVGVDGFGIDDPAAQRGNVVFAAGPRQVGTFRAAVAVDDVTADAVARERWRRFRSPAETPDTVDL
jgi:hypothetical protein